jgi:hypothetical protein
VVLLSSFTQILGLPENWPQLDLIPSQLTVHIRTAILYRIRIVVYTVSLNKPRTV